jgi:GNAT superfamily N-acetyltransferase
MPFDYRPATPARIAEYAALFHRCFPAATHFTADYLRWLYAENPDGEVLGFDAWDGNMLAAHYVCIPARARIDGESCRVLLSLNTATAPDYQGQGLFTRLASLTCERAAAEGFRAVYGVANANSTPGFVRKLGFTLVGPLEACVGVGPLVRGDWAPALAGLEFCREWSAAALAWRLRNPAAPVAASARANGTAFHVRARWPLLSGYAELPLQGASQGGGASLLRVFVGCLPQGLRRSPAWLPIPGFLKPSPLNLIYRDLQAPGFAPAAGRVLLGFPDFDAF